MTVPKISVCMATYNGQQYIAEQLQSILRQLRSDDEVIVCDDSSADATVAVVEVLNDPRVKLLRFDNNVGHVLNFERSLQVANGDFVFLADQDDIWREDKVDSVLRIFSENNSAVMVHHSLSTIDSEGLILQAVLNRQVEGEPSRFRFLMRQIARCNVYGCGLAFRRELMDVVMPFPSYLRAHDHWIAIAAAARGGVYLSSKTLVHYRQHTNNLTAKKKRPYLAQFRTRLQALRCLAIAIYRVLF
jgi:glycosyltransferase involved in cell wall biosynthesis